MNLSITNFTPPDRRRSRMSTGSSARQKRQSTSYSLACLKDADAMYQMFGIDPNKGASVQDFTNMIAPTLLSMIQSKVSL